MSFWSILLIIAAMNFGIASFFAIACVLVSPRDSDME